MCYSEESTELPLAVGSCNFGAQQNPSIEVGRRVAWLVGSPDKVERDTVFVRKLFLFMLLLADKRKANEYQQIYNR